jgi:PPM family protein phosphatase
MNETASAPEPFEIDIAAHTHAGSERGHNEDHCDRYIKSKTCGLVAVADGMALFEGGEVASRRATEEVVRSFRELAPGMTQIQRLVRAVRSANAEVYGMTLAVPQLRGASTTLTAVSISEGELAAAHVGNSRVYLIRNGYINQLSKDHTVAAEAMAEDRPFSAKDADLLTRCLGRELLVPVDLFEIDLIERDVVVVCTDGLYRALEDPQIVDVVKGLDANSACRKLIDEANGIGTLDNLAVGVVRVVGATPGERR